jgi:hypothetical protein
MPICASVLKLDASRFGHPVSDWDTLLPAPVCLQKRCCTSMEVVNPALGSGRIDVRSRDARAKAV